MPPRWVPCHRGGCRQNRRRSSKRQWWRRSSLWQCDHHGGGKAGGIAARAVVATTSGTAARGFTQPPPSPLPLPRQQWRLGAPAGAPKRRCWLQRGMAGREGGKYRLVAATTAPVAASWWRAGCHRWSNPVAPPLLGPQATAVRCSAKRSDSPPHAPVLSPEGGHRLPASRSTRGCLPPAASAECEGGGKAAGVTGGGGGCPGEVVVVRGRRCVPAQSRERVRRDDPCGGHTRSPPKSVHRALQRRAAQCCEARRKERTEGGERRCGLGHPQSRRDCLATNFERVDLVHATVCTCLRAASDARTGRPTREGEPGGGGVPLQRNWLR